MFYTRRVCPSLSAGICFCQFWVSLIFVFCPSLVIGESTWTALCKSVLWNITTFLQHSYIQEQRRVQQVLFQTCFSFYVTSRFFLTFPSLGRIQDPSLNFFTSLHSTGKTVFFQILEWIILITLRALNYSLARYVKKCLRAILKTFSKNETKCVLVICVFPRLKRSLFPFIGPETSRHFLNQSDAKVKQTASGSSAFPRAWPHLHIIVSSSRWRLVMLASVLFGDSHVHTLVSFERHPVSCQSALS